MSITIHACTTFLIEDGVVSLAFFTSVRRPSKMLMSTGASIALPTRSFGDSLTPFPPHPQEVATDFYQGRPCGGAPLAAANATGGRARATPRGPCVGRYLAPPPWRRRKRAGLL
jgi:hypothetical protein